MIERIIFGGQTWADLSGLKAAKNRVLKWVIKLRRASRRSFIQPDSMQWYRILEGG